MTTSVLDQMTRGIMERKGEAAAKIGRPSLTPVEGEAGTSVAEVAGLVPKDVPGVILSRETLQDQSKELRRYAAQLIVIAEGLDVMAGVPANVAAYETKLQEQAVKVAEKEADRQAADRLDAADGDIAAIKRVAKQEEFDAKLAAKSEAAQAATFAANDAGAEEEVFVDAAGGWVCPVHGPTTKELTSRKNRKYRACTQCEEFEK